MATAKTIPIEILRQLLTYNPETGTLTWLERPREFFKTDRYWKQWNDRFAGKPALASWDKSGRFTGAIFGKTFFAHRVIWALIHGEWPKDEIDHVRGMSAGNKPPNLREATHLENCKNQKLRATNVSGVIGVSWFKRTNRWHSQIMVNRKQIHLGYFVEKKKAIAARKAGEVKYGFHPNHGRVE
jgi:hypothetical protein